MSDSEKKQEGEGESGAKQTKVSSEDDQEPGPSNPRETSADVSHSASGHTGYTGLLELSAEYKDRLKNICERACDRKKTWSFNDPYIVGTTFYLLDEKVQHEFKCMMVNSEKKYPLETHLRWKDIFKLNQANKQNRRTLRSVLTLGVAGAGKTFSVLKFCLDWARGLENLDLVVPLFFRELNLVREKNYSLMELIQEFYPELQKLSPHTLLYTKVLFICDGLDESRLSLDFHCEVMSEVTQRSELSVLLVNLIRGDLLPDALVWITSRPAAASQIPARFIHRVTEVRGFFTDQQKEMFFRTRFADENKLQTILSHLRAPENLSLWIMCQIPVFCNITASVLDHMLRSSQSVVLPQTLTDLLTHFLMIMRESDLTERFNRFSVSEPELTSADRLLLLKLGRLAFEHLQTGNTLFYNEDLVKIGLDLSKASSGLYSVVLVLECVLGQSVFCFIHMILQEFMAAVYFHHCFRHNPDVVKEFLHFVDQSEGDCLSPPEFLKQSLIKSLQSPNGQLDLFVRFLHGLSLESNQEILGSLLSPVDQSEIPNVISNLKEMALEEVSPDRSINIFHCLMELKDQPVQRQIQYFQWSSYVPGYSLSMIQCSTLAYALQISQNVIWELNLNKYNTTLEGRQRLIPAVRNCSTALLTECGLTEAHCALVASALSSYQSMLTELDLSGNSLQKTHLRVLRKGLRSPNCYLRVLRLRGCALSDNSCGFLISSLKSNLNVLDLSKNPELNDPGWDFGHLQLRTLRLSACGLKDSACLSLASALKSSKSLSVLDLSLNSELKDSGVKNLENFLKDKRCQLEALSFQSCGLSDLSCQYLVSALTARPKPTLKDLDLRQNHLTIAGVRELSHFLRRPGDNPLTIRSDSLTSPFCGSLWNILTVIWTDSFSKTNLVF